MKYKTKYICPKCSKIVSLNSKYKTKGYFAVCLNCDEDFYKFELVEIKKTGTKKINKLIAKQGRQVRLNLYRLYNNL